VDARIEAGATMGEVEEFIESCPIREEEKAILWFEAWVEQPLSMRCSALRSATAAANVTRSSGRGSDIKIHRI
jgi:hypothetical protein